MKNIIVVFSLVFSSSALSEVSKIENFTPAYSGLEYFDFDNYSILFDKKKDEPVLAISSIKPNLKDNPVYTRSHLSKHNKTKTVQTRQKQAMKLSMDFSHLSSVYNTAHSPEQVLQGNADVNRVAMPSFFNRNGLWKLSENFAYEKSLDVGELIDLSGVVDYKEERYFYKVLVSEYSNGTIAFLFNENSKSIDLNGHITSVDCINSLTGFELLDTDVFDDIRSDKAYSLNVWALGDGNYERSQCEKI